MTRRVFISTTMHIPKDKQLKHLYIVVMGAHKHHEDVMMRDPMNPEESTYRQFPYAFKIYN